jgi:hypothetical protein
MAKNRKNQAPEIRFGPVLKVVLLCSLICGAALGYVWQKSQIDRLGRQISEREIKLKHLREENNTLANQIDFLRSPPMLDQRVKLLSLGLSPVQPMQVVRLADLPPVSAAEGSRQFAQRPVAGGTP